MFINSINAVICPSLIEIGSKTAEKNSEQTNRQTNQQTLWK